MKKPKLREMPEIEITGEIVDQENARRRLLTANMKKIKKAITTIPGVRKWKINEYHPYRAEVEIKVRAITKEGIEAAVKQAGLYPHWEHKWIGGQFIAIPLDKNAHRHADIRINHPKSPLDRAEVHFQCSHHMEKKIIAPEILDKMTNLLRALTSQQKSR